MANFMGIDLSEVKAPRSKYTLPKKPGKVQLTDVAAILAAVINGDLHGYENNRGIGTISEITVKSVEAGVKADSIGECTFGRWNIHIDDGEGGEIVREELCMNNWHSRAFGILRRYIRGELTEKELRIVLSVRFVTEFLESYQTLNGSPNHHTKDKIRNPDLAYGSILKRVSRAVGPDVEREFDRKKSTVFSSIIYNMTQPDRSWYWPEVYSLRNKAGNLANESAGYVVITAEQERRLIEAIQFWFALTRELRAASPNSAAVKNIIKSGGFFGYIVSDRLSGESILSPNHNVTVKKILKNDANVSRIATELCRANLGEVKGWTGDMRKILHGKSKKVSTMKAA